MPAFYSKSSRRHRKNALPPLWLFTDERVADDKLLRAVKHLPRGSGIIFRHYQRDADRRQALFERLRATAKPRDIAILLADAPHMAARWRADGYHLGSANAALGRKVGLVQSATAHTMRDVTRANRMGVDLLFLSPVFVTRSHPGGETLGTMRFAALARHAHMSVIALGGMTASRFRRVKPLGAQGWAAIDALTG